MHPKEFKSLWDWCEWSDYGKHKPDNAEFWRRFLVAISVYPADARERLIAFMVFMNKG